MRNRVLRDIYAFTNLAICHPLLDVRHDCFVYLVITPELVPGHASPHWYAIGAATIAEPRSAVRETDRGGKGWPVKGDPLLSRIRSLDQDAAPRRAWVLRPTRG